MDLGEESDTVIGALETIGARLISPRLVIPPTPQHELAHIARHADTAEERNRALAAISAAKRWRVVPINLMPVGHGIVERIAERLRSGGLLPAEEINDSFLVAETALLDGRLLLSSRRTPARNGLPPTRLGFAGIRSFLTGHRHARQSGE